MYPPQLKLFFCSIIQRLITLALEYSSYTIQKRNCWNYDFFSTKSKAWSRVRWIQSKYSGLSIWFSELLSLLDYRFLFQDICNCITWSCIYNYAYPSRRQWPSLPPPLHWTKAYSWQLSLLGNYLNYPNIQSLHTLHITQCGYEFCAYLSFRGWTAKIRRPHVRKQKRFSLQEQQHASMLSCMYQGKQLCVTRQRCSPTILG
jgi:hypothetical protein